MGENEHLLLLSVTCWGQYRSCSACSQTTLCTASH